MQARQRVHRRAWTRTRAAAAAGLAVTVVAPMLQITRAGAVTAPYDPFFAAPTTAADFGATTRPFGVAAGDYDGDGKADMVVGRTTGNVAFLKGNGDGTFAAPVVFAWKQTTFNAWAFAPADVNGDGKLDVVWGASAATSGCSVSPVPSTGCPSTVVVNDGDVRAFLGNGNGTFQETTYFVSGVRHNAGVLLADVGTDTGSVTAADIDGDGDTDVVAGALEGVRLLRNNGAGSFATTALDTSGTYFAATSTQNSPWGLALGDADADGDQDLFVGDRALYVYLYKNDGTGTFTITPGNIPGLETRPNVYLRHDSFRAAVGYTPSMAAGDVNGDGRADVVLGLHSGGQTPASSIVNDGMILLDVSTGSGHTNFGSLGDIGTVARGVNLLDVNGDGARDIVGGEYDGKVEILRQLPPKDSDSDGVSDYVDNAPDSANAPRVDMNADGSTTSQDQLDNDADTVLGNPEDQSTWQRNGDPADPDDDNDGVVDAADNCAFTANADQADVDGDGIGDACDPLDNRDSDGDGVPNGPNPGDPLYEQAKAAAIKWSQGDTHFVIRIDALGRFFQNEFTQLMTDAGTLTPEQWAAKCWENYQTGDVTVNGADYEPCGSDPTAAPTLDGGKGVPISLVAIPKQLWTDPPVVTWINDRNDNPLFELAQHGTYHQNNIPISDWTNLADRNFYSCEPCGLTEAENFELMKVGFDTLAGNYGNPWLVQSGATASSPKIDWSSSANPLLSYAPPFNTSDTAGRKAIAQLGFKSFSASRFEENGSYSGIFSPDGDHMEQFDQFGMFHASADAEIDPPHDGDPGVMAQTLADNTVQGGLNTWLIEEVEWSGRPCNDLDREAACPGHANNREDNTVYGPRWNAWMQLLDYVKSYPGGVAMTLGEVALAKAYDNAPTVANADQADSDHDGIGDVIDGASLATSAATVARNADSTLAATLTNAGAAPIAGQKVTFTFDADGDGTPETFQGTTDASGRAVVHVTATRPVGATDYSAAWDGGRGVTASNTGTVTVVDASSLSFDAGTVSHGQVTDAITVGVTLADTDGNGIGGRTVTFAVGSSSAVATTDGNGHASATLTVPQPAGNTQLTAGFAGDGSYASSQTSRAFTADKEDTVLGAVTVAGGRNDPVRINATLSEADGARLAGRTIRFSVEDKVKGKTTTVVIGTAVTGGNGVASFAVPSKYVSNRAQAVDVVFDGDSSFVGSATTVNVSR